MIIAKLTNIHLIAIDLLYLYIFNIKMSAGCLPSAIGLI
jgi:hypothetical protein